MKSFNVLQPLDSIVTVFTGIGVLHPEKSWSLRQVLHFAAFPGLFSVVYFIALTVNLVKAKNIEGVTEGLYMTLTLLALMARLVNFIVKRKKFLAFAAKVRSPLIEPKTNSEIALFKDNFKMYNLLGRSFIVFTIVIIIIAGLLSVLSEPHQLPLPAWYPFDWENVPMHFWIAFSYLILAATCTSIIIISFDLAHGLLFLQISIYYRLISARLQTIGHKPSTGTLLSNRKNEMAELIECIQMHQFVDKLCEIAQDIWSIPIAVQIFVSGLVICSTIFHLNVLSPVTDTPLFFLNFFYLEGMIIEILLPCYYGDQLSSQSELVLSALYSSNWTEMPQEFKKTIFCFMESLKRPRVMLAGGYFPIELKTMESVLQNAYSLFALLKTMDN